MGNWLERFRRKPEKHSSKQDHFIEIGKGLDSSGSKEVVSQTASSWRDRQLVMETDMRRLCDGLSIQTKAFEVCIEQWLQDLDRYIDAHERLMYSSISNYIYGLADENYASFESNLYTVFQYVMEQDMSPQNPASGVWEKRRRVVMKLYDHVNLARRQFVLYSQKRADVEAIVERKIAPELAKSSKELTSQLVGLVAIFTALSFIVFGGISSLESLFAALSQKDNAVLPTIIIAIIWALCLMNLLFLFMYFVLRVTGNNVGATDESKSFMQKYPFVLVSNYILVSALLLSLGAWAAWVTGVGKGIYDFVLSYRNIAFIIGLIILVVIIVVFGHRLWKSLNAQTSNA